MMDEFRELELIEYALRLQQPNFIIGELQYMRLSYASLLLEMGKQELAIRYLEYILELEKDSESGVSSKAQELLYLASLGAEE